MIAIDNAISKEVSLLVECRPRLAFAFLLLLLQNEFYHAFKRGILKSSELSKLQNEVKRTFDVYDSGAFDYAIGMAKVLQRKVENLRGKPEKRLKTG